MLENLSYPDSVCPEGWCNPEPADKYDLVVLGAGAAGLISAIGGARMGARVALVEKSLLGGDCLNYGCVPSKALIEASRRARCVDTSEEFGINVDSSEVDFSAIMDRLRSLRAGISAEDSAIRVMSEGVDLFLGEGVFDSPSSLIVGDATLNFSKAIVATGGRANVPPVEGLEGSGYLINETFYDITDLPARLVIIGGGPIACEMGQALARLGSKVIILQRGDRFLHREDAEASEVLRAQFELEGIDVRFSSDVSSVRLEGETRVVSFVCGDEKCVVEADQILVAAGRTPVVDGLGLEEAGVEYDLLRGVVVNEGLQTSNLNIYSAGDCCLKYKFTHAADAAARICLRNAFFPGKASFEKVVMSWCTYTDPEIAHVGLYESQAVEAGKKVSQVKVSLKDVHRSVIAGTSDGFLKVLVGKRGKILGGTLVAAHAGDMISELAVAMKAGLRLSDLSSVVHPYPTEAGVFKKAGDLWSSRRLTPLLKVFLRLWLLWVGRTKKKPVVEEEKQEVASVTPDVDVNVDIETVIDDSIEDLQESEKLKDISKDID